MRQLTKDERELTERNLKRSKDELISLQMNKKYNQSLIDKQNQLREFDDKWREYLRKQKDEDDKKVINALEQEIDIRKFTIKTAEEQLKNGVEEKKILGV
jgi:hypothetical protein